MSQFDDALTLRVRSSQKASLARFDELLPGVLLLGGAFVVVLNYFLCAPWPLVNVAGRLDESVYALGGAEWLHGHIPYSRFWDNKPPSIYLLNAFAWSLSGNLLGIWIISVLCSLMTLVLFFKICSSIYGRGPALLASVYFFTAMLPFSSPNVVNNFVVTLNLVAAAIAVALVRQGRRPSICAVALGLIWGFTFLMRPNAMLTQSVIVSGVAYWRLSAVGWPRAFTFLLTAAAGALLYPGSMALYFYHNHALTAFVDCVIRFNAAYVTGRPIEHVRTLLFGIPVTAGGNVALLSAACLWMAWPSPRHPDPLRRRSASLLILLLGLELILASASGRRFEGYFVPAIPVGGFIVCALAWDLADRFGTAWRQLPGRMRAAATVISFLAIAAPAMLAFTVNQGATLSGKGFWFNHPVADIGQYLQDHASGDRSFFVWGDDPGAYLLSGRDPDIRFSFALPFLIPNYVDDKLVAELVAELEARKPELIFDLSAREAGIPPLSNLMLGRAHDLPLWETYEVTPPLLSLGAYVRQHYRVSDVTGRTAITVFKRIPEPASLQQKPAARAPGDG